MPSLDEPAPTSDSEAPEYRDAAEVGAEESRAEWAVAAREVLGGTARRYRAVITYQELADEVQERTMLRSTQPMRYWINDVLTLVGAECVSRGEPMLSALAVNAQGSVGEGYAVAVQAAYGERPEDPDRHAAAERLAVHHHAEAAGIPADGGTAALTPRLQGARDRGRKTRLAERPIPLCPVCNTALPATGVCDFCD